MHLEPAHDTFRRNRRVVITGAFSYTGAAVARELIARGYDIHTLTNRRAPVAPQQVLAEQPKDASSMSFRRKPESSLTSDYPSALDTGLRRYDVNIPASHLHQDSGEQAAGMTSSPLTFDAEHLEREMSGVDVFVNTFWIRLPYRGEDFSSAVEKSRLLAHGAEFGNRYVNDLDRHFRGDRSNPIHISEETLSSTGSSDRPR